MPAGPRSGRRQAVERHLTSPNDDNDQPWMPSSQRVRALTGRTLATRLPVVGELQRDAEVLGLEQGDDGLQVVPLLAGDAQLVALDLRLHTLGSLVTDLLADRLRLVG